MCEQIDVVYEKGVLRQLGPLPSVPHQNHCNR